MARKIIVLLVGYLIFLGYLLYTTFYSPKETAPKQVIYGIASWYGDYFHGKPMSNRKPFDMNKVSVAHRDLPLDVTKVLVTNTLNGKEVIALVTDRGPYVKKKGRYTRDLDLSKEAARQLGAIEAGLIPVRIEVLE